MDGRRWMVFVVRDRVITDFKNMADPPPSPPLSPPPPGKVPFTKFIQANRKK